MLDIYHMLVREREPRPEDNPDRDGGVWLYRQYRRYLRRTRDADDDRLRPFARWVLGTLAAETVPSMEETQVELAWLARQNMLRSTNGPVFRRLLRVCQGLLEPDGLAALRGKSRVGLVHHSLREVLLRQPIDSCLGHWDEIVRSGAGAQ
jgi:hypothetical protein